MYIYVVPRYSYIYRENKAAESNEKKSIFFSLPNALEKFQPHSSSLQLAKKITKIKMKEKWNIKKKKTNVCVLRCIVRGIYVYQWTQSEHEDVWMCVEVSWRSSPGITSVGVGQWVQLAPVEVWDVVIVLYIYSITRVHFLHYIWQPTVPVPLTGDAPVSG